MYQALIGFKYLWDRLILAYRATFRRDDKLARLRQIDPHIYK